MRFPYALIALILGLTSTVLTVLAQSDSMPPRLPQCPVAQATRQVPTIEYGQITPPEAKVPASRDSRSQRDWPCPQARANGRDHVQQPHQQEIAARFCSHGEKTTHAIRGSCPKPQTKNISRVVFRSPLPARSIMYYQSRRYVEAELEFQAHLRRQEYLAMREQLARMAGRHVDGYKLKAGNYQLPPGRMLHFR